MTTLEPEFVHTDKRRSIIQLLTADLKQVNTYVATKGSCLGDHYHKQTTEYFYIISGNIIYNNERVLEEGSFFVVYPQENHTLECLTDVRLMTFLTKPFDERNPDLWKK